MTTNSNPLTTGTILVRKIGSLLLPYIVTKAKARRFFAQPEPAILPDGTTLPAEEFRAGTMKRINGSWHLDLTDLTLEQIRAHNVAAREASEKATAASKAKLAEEKLARHNRYLSANPAQVLAQAQEIPGTGVYIVPVKTTSNWHGNCSRPALLSFRVQEKKGWEIDQAKYDAKAATPRKSWTQADWDEVYRTGYEVYATLTQGGEAGFTTGTSITEESVELALGALLLTMDAEVLPSSSLPGPSVPVIQPTTTALEPEEVTTQPVVDPNRRRSKTFRCKGCDAKVVITGKTPEEITTKFEARNFGQYIGDTLFCQACLDKPV